MEKYNFMDHKFRASGFGNLMGGSKEISESQLKKIEELGAKKIEVKGLGKGDSATLEKYKALEEPNDKQKEKISELEAKKVKPTGLTEIQQTELSLNISLRDNPLDHLKLSTGAKTVLRKMRREIKFKRRRELNSKYLAKGTKLEEDAITFLSDHHDEVFSNNSERRFSEYFQGECDVPEGFDTKVSWSLDTLPDPEEKLQTIYEYRDRIYMILWEKDQWTTSAIVLNMLDDEIKKVLYGEAWKWDNNEIPDGRKIEIIKHYVYDEENFIRILIDNEVVVNQEMEEGAMDQFNDFVEIPDYERIVEKTVYRDLGIEAKMNKIAELSRVYMQGIEDEMYQKYLESQEV